MSQLANYTPDYHAEKVGGFFMDFSPFRRKDDRFMSDAALPAVHG